MPTGEKKEMCKERRWRRGVWQGRGGLGMRDSARIVMTNVFNYFRLVLRTFDWPQNAASAAIQKRPLWGLSHIIFIMLSFLPLPLPCGLSTRARRMC